MILHSVRDIALLLSSISHNSIRRFWRLRRVAYDFMTGSVVWSYVWYERPVDRGSLGQPRSDLIMNSQSFWCPRKTSVEIHLWVPGTPVGIWFSAFVAFVSFAWLSFGMQNPVSQLPFVLFSLCFSLLMDFVDPWLRDSRTKLRFNSQKKTITGIKQSWYSIGLHVPFVIPLQTFGHHYSSTVEERKN